MIVLELRLHRNVLRISVLVMVLGVSYTYARIWAFWFGDFIWVLLISNEGGSGVQDEHNFSYIF